MAFEADAARSQRLEAIAPVVRLLCEVRLVVLVLAVVSASPAFSTWWQVGLAVVAAPCSYLPARHWAKQGGRIASSGIYLGLDSVVAITVIVAFDGAETALLYGGATVTLLGVVAGRVIALMGAALLGSAMVGVSVGQAGSAAAIPVMIAAGLGCAALAIAGDALGTALRRQAHTAGLLATERATRTADLERLSVARDVHDSVAGSLAGLTLMTEALHRKVLHETVDDATLLLARQVRDASRIAHVDTRAVLAQLRQLDPDPVATLEQVCRRWSLTGGVATEFATEGDAPLDGALGVAFKAILTELLENVRKHARAQRVEVRLLLGSDHARLTVIDDGVGLDADAPGAAEGHYGLCGLRERAEEMDGSVEVGSRPGRTEITVMLRAGAAERVGS